MGKSEHSFPKIVVFDLDYTLWPCWCDTHISPPISRSKTENAIVDRYGSEMAFYNDVPAIIAHLKQSGIKVAAASRTCAPDVAKKMLSLLHIGGTRAIDYFDVLEIYPGSKITHFNFIQKQTGIEYRDMLFFDDETRNKEVEHRLGVKFMFVTEGVTWKLYHQAIEDWRGHKQQCNA
ncbi:magnesium-dependent phosphatase-1 [Lipomyces kononenkoae]|uniref:Magnesium-dependent phosphatase-1 n=1 Tax=Lipomyces kononenkoae TaxID=34357 RepID=A0ACC3T5Y3_LIPKO